jgi:apolipoprotein N-acyltransferase
MSQLILPALTGLFLAASFPRGDQGWLAWLAWIPLIISVAQSKNRRLAFGGGFFSGVLGFFILLVWIPQVLARYGGLSSGLAWTAYTLLVFVLACYPAFACALVKHMMIRRGNGMLLFFPIVWILFEFALSVSPLGGFPWLLAGYTQVEFLPVIQIAEITGIYGVSFSILAINTGIAWIILCRKRRLSTYIPLVGAVALFVSCLLYGRIALKHWESLKPRFQAAMLQGNLSEDDSKIALVEKFQQGYISMADRLNPPNVDLLILPESPAPTFFQFDEDYRKSMETLARRYPLGLVLSNIQYKESEGSMRYFNSAFFLDRNGSLTGVYDKIHRVPFGEYIPMQGLFSFIETISKDVGGFYAGKDTRLIPVGGHPANAIICFEAVFPGLVRRFVDQGSQLIINLTNDGWYGISAAPFQHLMISRLRAVENRRYFLRATNSGISAVIEPSGKIQSSTGLMQEAIGQGHFDFLTEKTFYTRYGDVFIFLCAIILFGTVIRIEYSRCKRGPDEGIR